MLRFVIVYSLLHIICAFDSRQRCLFLGAKCVSHCPPNMHAYHTRCDGQTMSQRTCDAPQVYVLGYTCGWSRCDCNGDLMLDEYTGVCVTNQGCSTVHQRPSKRRRLPSEHKKLNRKRSRLSKRVKIEKDEMF